MSYIASQESHHRKMTFQEEFRSLVVKHGISFDERYVGGLILLNLTSFQAVRFSGGVSTRG